MWTVFLICFFRLIMTIDPMTHFEKSFLKGITYMKVSGTSSHVYLDMDDRIIKAEGEMIVGGFVAYKSTMKFEPPYENEPVSDESRQKYIDEALKKTKDSGMKLEFE